MATVKNKAGFGCGFVIILLALIVFCYSIPAKNAMDPIAFADLTYAPRLEENLAYGGDAYTGIQQAGAQTANNTYAVVEAIQIQNGNMIKQTKTIVSALKLFFGFTLLAIGLVLITNSLEYETYKPEERIYVPRTGPANTPVVATQSKTPAPVTASVPKPAAPETTNTVQSDASAPVGWVCSCGAQNQFYVTTCACGKKKRDVMSEGQP